MYYDDDDDDYKTGAASQTQPNMPSSMLTQPPTGPGSSTAYSAGSGSGQTGLRPLNIYTKDPKVAERTATALTNYEAIKSAEEVLNNSKGYIQITIPGVGTMTKGRLPGARPATIPQGKNWDELHGNAQPDVAEYTGGTPSVVGRGGGAFTSVEELLQKSPVQTVQRHETKRNAGAFKTQSDFGGGDAQSGEPPVMPWDYHEDPIAWLNRRAAEMYKREEA